MNNAFYRKTIEKFRGRMILDLLDKTDTKRVKIGKTKVTVVDKSADSVKFNLYECNQFLIATSHLEYPTTMQKNQNFVVLSKQQNR